MKRVVNTTTSIRKEDKSQATSFDDRFPKLILGFGVVTG
jgi:hypothetical protein